MVRVTTCLFNIYKSEKETSLWISITKLLVYDSYCGQSCFAFNILTNHSMNQVNTLSKLYRYPQVFNRRDNSDMSKLTIKSIQYGRIDQPTTNVEKICFVKSMFSILT